ATTSRSPRTARSASGTRRWASFGSTTCLSGSDGGWGRGSSRTRPPTRRRRRGSISCTARSPRPTSAEAAFVDGYAQRSMRRATLAACVTVAVAAASADSSVVALALPQLYGEFRTTVVGVSWVLTAYNAAVAGAALAVLPVRRRFPIRRLYGAGVV